MNRVDEFLYYRSLLHGVSSQLNMAILLSLRICPVLVSPTFPTRRADRPHDLTGTLDQPAPRNTDLPHSQPIHASL